jgi:hypothetical protein
MTKMKQLIIVILVLLAIMNTGKSYNSTGSKLKEYSLKDDINLSIIDGFFNGDTTGVNIDTVYFVQ